MVARERALEQTLYINQAGSFITPCILQKSVKTLMSQCVHSLQAQVAKQKVYL